MQFSVAAVLAFAASALAQTAGFDPISKPTDGEKVPAGSTYSIVWESSANYTGSVTITLLGGASAGTLQDVSTIAKSVDNSKGTYSWPVASSLGSLATYGIRISLDSDPTIFQYSFPFAISGGGSSSSASSSSASATATTTASASASATATATGTTATTVSTTASPTATGSVTTTATTLSQTTLFSTVTASGSTTASASGTKTSTPASVATGGAVANAAGPMVMLGALAAGILVM